MRGQCEVEEESNNYRKVLASVVSVLCACVLCMCVCMCVCMCFVFAEMSLCLCPFRKSSIYVIKYIQT